MAQTTKTDLPKYLEKPTKTALGNVETWLNSDKNYVYGSKPGESLYTGMNGMQEDALGNTKWLADQDLNEMFGLNDAKDMWNNYASAGPELIKADGYDFTVDQGIGNAKNVTDPNFSYDITQGLGQAADLNEASYGRAADTLSTTGVMDESGALGSVASYMSPYLQQVLDPQVREIQQESERQRRSIGASANMSGAFGDARHGIMEGENYEKTNQAIGDATGKTMADAFLNAMTQRQADAGRMDAMNMTDAQLTEAAQGRKLTAGQSNQSMAENALQRQLQGDTSTGQFAQSGAQLGVDVGKANQASANDALSRQLQANMKTGEFGLQGAQLEQQANLANQASRQNANERMATTAQAYQSIGNNSLQNFQTVNDSLMNAGTLAQGQEELKRQAQQQYQQALASKDYDSAMKLLAAVRGSPMETKTTTSSNDGLMGLVGSVLGGIF